MNAYSANISSGGLFIKTDSPLPVGEPLSLQIEMPDVAEALKLRCEVVWKREKAEIKNRLEWVSSSVRPLKRTLRF